MIDNQTQKNLREKYNPEGSDLRNLQNRMLEILKCVDEICQRHKIPYWLSSGTLLGAVRHGGFIPWDDDIDIELLREDYLKLITILPQELPAHYRLQTKESDTGYVYIFAKVRDTQSLIEEKIVFNKHFQLNGAFIDIFPLEHTQKHLAKIALVCYNRLCLNVVEKYGPNKLFNIFHRLLTKWLFPLFRAITPKKSAIIHHTYGVGFLKNERHTTDIYPLKRINFEGYLFNAPSDCDKYLKRIYGNDYMKLPTNIETHINKINIWE